jgi:hypothetical protein
MPARPATFETVLKLELDEIQQTRQRRTPEVNITPPASSDPYSVAGDAQLFGVAFSGGGIRSATFNLGILQALGEMDMLRWVDYLSTVSGGGYIGSWLAAWLKRVAPIPPATPVGEVEHRLSPQESSRFSGEPVNPIQFLRRYSNYLTPRLGFFGADTWTMISIYLRNVILNQAILISAIAAVLLVPRFASWPFYSVDADDTWLKLLSPAGLVCAMVFIAMNLWRLESNGAGARLPYYARQGGIQVLIVWPVLAATYLFSLALWQYAESLSAPPSLADFAAVWWPPVATFAVLLLLVGFCGVFRRSVKTGKTPAAAGLVLLASLVPAACGGMMFWGLGVLFAYTKSFPGALWHALAWGPPVLIGVFSLTAVLHLGLMGINFPDSGREWWSRLGAWLCIYMLGWAGLVTVVIYGPLILALSFRALAGVSAAWIATTVGGILAGRSSSTSGTNGRLARNILARLAPYVFIAGLLLAISTGLQVVLPWSEEAFAWKMERQLFTSPNLPMSAIITKHFQILDTTEWSSVWIALGALATAAALLSWRVDINEFSMHHFYRNRLVRCYLGASHLRKPQSFTGFDPHDDVRLADLAGPGFTGPYPLVNTTINLVSGEDLAWQQRKGASFIFTPKFCGYQISGHPGARGDARPDLTGAATCPGYRETRHYAYPELGGISLGTAMAISGAAASPNEGYHSSPATAFLMTVFDVRLGWWLGNPAGKKSHRSAPKFALVHLMRELFGLTNQGSNFVYLSDGGHFENLGIYELVRRRCRYIIACDSGQDGDLGFEDLGNAIRKCRTDMGLDIEIDIDSIRRQANGPSRWHCAVGTIHYDMVDRSASNGTLVYIKSSLTGDEAADVLSYHTQKPAFPHQSTADQWFDESQFESYRKLGYHVGLTTLGAAGQQRPMRNGAESFFVALRQAWYPPSQAVSSSFSKHAIALNQLFERLSQDENLHFLDAQIYPEWRRLNASVTSPPPVDLWLPAKPEELRAGFYFCNSLIQLMECVYLDLHLDQEQDHPDNRGWMNLFKHWAWSGMLRATWAVSVSTYGARFQTFCRNSLGLDTGEVQVELKGINAPELNFHERALVDELCRVYPDVKQTGSVLLLQMVVSDLSVADASRPASSFRFTFGLAVLFQNQFVLFRIQDHLRTIGLGRLALHKVIDRYRFDPGLLQQINQSEHTEQDTEVTEELRRMGSATSRRHFDQLLRSVEREPKTPALGAHA